MKTHFSLGNAHTLTQLHFHSDFYTFYIHKQFTSLYMFSCMFIACHIHKLLLFLLLATMQLFCLVNNTLPFVYIYMCVRFVVNFHIITSGHTGKSAISVVRYTFQETRVFRLNTRATYILPRQIRSLFSD